MSYPTLPADQTYAYTYDDNGNILSATFGDYSYSYVYDSQNQLIRENNSKLGRTYTWTYDNAGNILSRSTYAYTTGDLGEPTSILEYRYEDADWGDLLTGINSNVITYDQIGNMVSFGSRTFTWEHGRQLASQTVNGSTWTYTYDASGMRTGRTNGTNTYEYIYNGSQLKRMTRNGVVVDFTYINGIPATLTFDGNTFYYVVNGQGDVTGITDNQRNVLVSYYYDAWGNSSYTVASGAEYASTLLTINPLLYRGYVLDREVGMYYLQSRYYIPEIGRFLNADGYTSTGQGVLGNNMFAYCGNNSVIRSDFGGCFWDVVFDVGSLCISVADVIQNPGDSAAWLGLGADVVSLAIPCVSGGGTVVRAVSKTDDVVDTVRAVSKADDVVDAARVADKVDNAVDASKVGWHVGDDITNLTKAGNVPTWSTIRRRYWKNEAYYHPELYPYDLYRLQKGLAPYADDGFPMELHHPWGRRGYNYYIFESVTHTQHRWIHYGE